MRAYRYQINLFGEDGRTLGGFPLAVDGVRAEEAARLSALKLGLDPSAAYGAPVNLRPRWNRSAGEPYVEGLDAHVGAGDALVERLPLSFLGEGADGLLRAFVQEGRVREGESCTYVVTAYETEAPSGGAPGDPFGVEESEATVEVSSADLDAYVHRAGVLVDAEHAAEVDVEVFVHAGAIAHAEALVVAQDATRETGGILLGHLRRCIRTARLAVEVTAFIPGEFAEADAVSLSFGAGTWSALAAAQRLRNCGEATVGWLHSHPVRAWCAKCAPDRQRVCPMQDLFSAHDRALHRAVFPAAFNLALVLSDVGFRPKPIRSLYGWRHGEIVKRAYRVLDDPSVHRGAPRPSDKEA